MKTIFDSCKPREEVLKGELKEQQFAASLTKVLRGTAEPVYGDPATFFANTFATGGLKSLLREALGRLSGKRPDGASVIRLETSFGGGKTHNLIAPSADAPRKAGNLAHQLLQPDEQGQMAKDQSEVVLKVLKGLDKVLTADDRPLNAQYVKAKAWTQNAVTMTTEDLRRAFCQRLGLKMLLDINQLKKTIKEGVQRGVWIYYVASEGFGYGPPSPSPVVEISEDASLHTLEEAKRVGIKIKGEEPVEETCPVCKKFPCVCGEEGEDDEEDKRKARRVSGEGTPAQAFQAIADQCHCRR